MEITILETKDIARQVKRADLAATVRQQLMAPNRTFYHLINIVRGLCFSEDLSAFEVLKLA